MWTLIRLPICISEFPIDSSPYNILRPDRNRREAARHGLIVVDVQVLCVSIPAAAKRIFSTGTSDKASSEITRTAAHNRIGRHERGVQILEDADRPLRRRCRA